jgi:hypothetical protein
MLELFGDLLRVRDLPFFGVGELRVVILGAAVRVEDAR